MVLKKVSPGERAVLERFGWKDGDPVPENLAELISETAMDAQGLDYMPPPVDLKTPALRLPREVDISKLPSAEQDKYAQVLAALSDSKVQKLAAEELNASLVENGGGVDAFAINQAIRAANVLTDDTDAPTYANGAKKREEVAEEIKPQGTQETGPTYCPHCGWNQKQKDELEVTEEDRLSFLQTLLGLQVFSKTYTVYGGALTVRVKSLTPKEADLCFRQVFLDRQAGRTANPAEEAEHLARYKAALQIESVTGPGLAYVAPQHGVSTGTEQDTIVFSIWQQFAVDIDKSEAMHRVLLGVVGRFNALVNKLEDNVDNENFWPAID